MLQNGCLTASSNDLVISRGNLSMYYYGRAVLIALAVTNDWTPIIRNPVLG